MSGPAVGPDDPAAALVDHALLDRVPGRLGLAVSGGSDSTALAVLLAPLPREMVILTVDHGLRRAGTGEVFTVRLLGKRLGLHVEVLRPTDAPSGSVQAWARQARYALFAEASKRLGLAAVATGHTLDDQAETFVLRLARGSGLKGLCAMQPVTRRGPLTIVRPLLGARRERLRAVLSARGLRWCEDPSNADPAFARTTVRSLMPQLAAIGATPERLAASAAHLSRAADVIDAAVQELLGRAHRDRAGAVTFPRGPYAAAHEEVRLRALALLVQEAGGKPYGPTFDALSSVDRAIAAGTTTTLGRAIVASDAACVTLWREARDIRPVRLVPGRSVVFDGRFEVSAAADAGPGEVTALGEDLARGLPPVAHRGAMASAPVLMRDGAVVAAPTLGLFARGARRDEVTVTPVRRSAPSGPRP